MQGYYQGWRFWLLGCQILDPFAGPEGVASDGAASARDVTNLIRQTRSERIKAVFIENTSNPKVLEQPGKEADVSSAGELYSDALSAPDSAAPIYLKMMRHYAFKLLVG